MSDKVIEKRSPYINTYLNADICILPKDMNNDIQINIKNAVIQLYANKCFYHYGYIEKIYKVINKSEYGLIQHEDPTASAKYKVSFLCRLCNPIKNTKIVAQVSQIDTKMTMCHNGQMHVVIIMKNIHQNPNFMLNTLTNTLTYTDPNNNTHEIKKGSYVFVTVEHKKIEHMIGYITVYGSIDSIATSKDWEENVRNEYSESYEEVTDINKYLKEDSTNLANYQND